MKIAFWTVLVSTLLTCAVGLVSGWVPPPKKLGNYGALAILVILIACLVSVILIGHKGDRARSTTGRRAGRPAAPVATSKTTPAAFRSLQSWVSDVNQTCAPVMPKMKAEKARFGASSSPEEQIASLKNAQKLLTPIVRDISSAIELPSGPSERSAAKDWINSYKDFYVKLIEAIRKLEDHAASNPISRALDASNFKSVQQSFADAATNTKGKGDALGIICPGVNYDES